jgi:hypothetical protein
MPGAPSDREMTKGAFDGVAFWLALNNKAHERDMNMREVSTVTGVLPATLSRIRNNKTAPDVPNFLALCQWGGFNPTDFWRPSVERTRVAIIDRAVVFGLNDIDMSTDAKIIGFSQTDDEFFIRTLQRVTAQSTPLNQVMRKVLVVNSGILHGHSLDELRPIPGLCWEDGTPVSAFEVIKI